MLLLGFESLRWGHGRSGNMALAFCPFVAFFGSLALFILTTSLVFLVWHRRDTSNNAVQLLMS